MEEEEGDIDFFLEGSDDETLSAPIPMDGREGGDVVLRDCLTVPMLFIVLLCFEILVVAWGGRGALHLCAIMVGSVLSIWVITYGVTR